MPAQRRKPDFYLRTLNFIFRGCIWSYISKKKIQKSKLLRALEPPELNIVELIDRIVYCIYSVVIPAMWIIIKLFLVPVLIFSVAPTFTMLVYVLIFLGIYLFSAIVTFLHGNIVISAIFNSVALGILHVNVQYLGTVLRGDELTNTIGTNIPFNIMTMILTPITFVTKKEVNRIAGLCLPCLRNSNAPFIFVLSFFFLAYAVIIAMRLMMDIFVNPSVSLDDPNDRYRALLYYWGDVFTVGSMLFYTLIRNLYLRVVLEDGLARTKVAVDDLDFESVELLEFVKSTGKRWFYNHELTQTLVQIIGNFRNYAQYLPETIKRKNMEEYMSDNSTKSTLKSGSSLKSLSSSQSSDSSQNSNDNSNDIKGRKERRLSNGLRDKDFLNIMTSDNFLQKEGPIREAVFMHVNIVNSESRSKIRDKIIKITEQFSKSANFDIPSTFQGNIILNWNLDKPCANPLSRALRTAKTLISRINSQLIIFVCSSSAQIKDVHGIGKRRHFLRKSSVDYVKLTNLVTSRLNESISFIKLTHALNTHINTSIDVNTRVISNNINYVKCTDSYILTHGLENIWKTVVRYYFDMFRVDTLKKTELKCFDSSVSREIASIYLIGKALKEGIKHDEWNYEITTELDSVCEISDTSNVYGDRDFEALKIIGKNNPLWYNDFLRAKFV